MSLKSDRLELGFSIIEVQAFGASQNKNFSLVILHTRFCNLVRWTVVIGAMLKQGLAKKCTYEVL